MLATSLVTYRRIAAVALLLLPVVGSEGAPAAATEQAKPVSALRLDGSRFNPFNRPGDKLVAFIFVMTDCPISNRYAPEIQRINADYSGKGVAFYRVHVEPDVSLETVKKHVSDYGFKGQVLVDPELALARFAGATIAPEAALFRPDGRLLYRGRIDNWYVALGKPRRAATERDFRNAMDAALAGKPIANPRTQAIGCFIPYIEVTAYEE